MDIGTFATNASTTQQLRYYSYSYWYLTHQPVNATSDNPHYRILLFSWL